MKQQYQNSVTEIKTLLFHNTDYYDCFLMNKIFSDIESYKTKNFLKEDNIIYKFK